MPQRGYTNPASPTGAIFYDGGRYDGPVDGADLADQLREVDGPQLDEEYDDREERKGPKVEPDHRGAGRWRVLRHCEDDGGRKRRVCRWVKVINISVGESDREAFPNVYV